MKKLAVLSVLFFLLVGNVVFAQNQNNITWEMAVVKWTGSGEESFSPKRPLSFKSGEEYYLYIKSDSPAYCYIVQENADRTSSIIFNGILEAGKEMPIPDDNDFTVPSGTGTIRYYVIISSTPKTNLNRQGTLSGNQHTALIDEIQTISMSLSTAQEKPEQQVVIGGGTRGSSTMAYQYGGLETYVKTIVIGY